MGVLKSRIIWVRLWWMLAIGHLTRKEKWTRPSPVLQTVVSCSQAIALIGFFNLPCVCWRDNTPQFKQSRRLLECINDIFLTQGIQHPIRRGALLDLILTTSKSLIAAMKVRSITSCTDCEMVEFRMLEEGSTVKNKFTILMFRRVLSGLFKDLLGKLPCDKALEGRGAAQKCAYYSRITSSKTNPSKQEVTQKCQEAHMDEQDAAGKTQAQKQNMQKVSMLR